jgi:hypothetical protein
MVLLLGILAYSIVLSIPKMLQELHAAPPPKMPMASTLPTDYPLDMDLTARISSTDRVNVVVPTLSNRNGTWGGGPSSGYITGIDRNGADFRLTLSGEGCTYVFRKPMNGDVKGDYAFKPDESICSCEGITATVSNR